MPVCLSLSLQHGHPIQGNEAVAFVIPAFPCCSAPPPPNVLSHADSLLFPVSLCPGPQPRCRHGQRSSGVACHLSWVCSERVFWWEGRRRVGDGVETGKPAALGLLVPLTPVPRQPVWLGEGHQLRGTVKNVRIAPPVLGGIQNRVIREMCIPDANLLFILFFSSLPLSAPCILQFTLLPCQVRTVGSWWQ